MTNNNDGQGQFETTTDTDTRTAPWWNVILHNDEEHSYPYVIAMIKDVFHKNMDQAKEITKQIDLIGVATVHTCEKEKAELFQEKVHAWGADDSMILSGKPSTGPIKCTIEQSE